MRFRPVEGFRGGDTVDAFLRNEKGDDPEDDDVVAPNGAVDSTGDSTARPLPFLSTFDGVS